jgi:hypothetical protein
MMDQRIAPALCRADRLIEVACLHLAVSREALVGPRRNREIAAARKLVCYVLRRAGYSAFQIGLRLGRNHSTVVHALRRVEQTPILVEQAAELIEMVLPFAGEDGKPVPSVAQALSRVVLRSLMGLVALREVHAARAYVLGRLLARERVDNALAATGLLVIAIRPAVRLALEEALANCGLSAYAGLIPLHLRQAGASRWKGPVCPGDESSPGRRSYENCG